MTETTHWILSDGALAAINSSSSLLSLIPLQYPGLLLGQPLLHVLLIVLLLVFNGFFVATEVALVKLRAAQLNKKLDGQSDETIELTRKILDNLGRYIPACKFGASVAGVLLGAVSVPFLTTVLVPCIETIGFNSLRMDRLIAFALAVSIILGLLVVFGKIIPNSLGFRRELAISTASSKPLHWFYLIGYLAIVPLTLFSNWVITKIIRIEPASEQELEHSAEELKMFVEESGKDAVTDTEKEILINALELNDLKVLDIVTPRQEVFALDINDPFEKSVDKALKSKHSRFPLIDGDLDNPVGLIHVKDLMDLMRQKNPYLLKKRRDIIQVKESMALDQLLNVFLEQKVHLALVVDKYGGTQGIVVLNDLLEQLVGDIQDEFEEEAGGDEEHHLEIVNENEFVIGGSMPLHELDDKIPELDLESEDVATVGGYVTAMIGHNPEVGEKTTIEGFEAEVTDADDIMVHEVKFSRLVDTHDHDDAPVTLSDEAEDEIIDDEPPEAAEERQNIDSADEDRDTRTSARSTELTESKHHKKDKESQGGKKKAKGKKKSRYGAAS